MKDNFKARLRDRGNPAQVTLKDLTALKDAFFNLKAFEFGYCLALMADRCACICRRRNWKAKEYSKAKERIENRLDIVKLIKVQIDLEILKKLLLIPKQRALFKKQRRRTLKVETSSSSAPSEDSDMDAKIFAQNGFKSIVGTQL